MPSVSLTPYLDDLGDATIYLNPIFSALPVFLTAAAFYGGLNIPPNLAGSFALRFDLDIPAAATVTGVRLTMDKINGVGQTSKIRAGWLKPDTFWESALCWDAYAFQNQVPRPWSVSGSTAGPNDFTIFQGDAVAFSQANNLSLLNSELILSDGTLTGGTATGTNTLVAKLNDYLAANQSLRDQDGATGIPIAIQVFPDRTIPIGSTTAWASFHSSAGAIGSTPPTLEVEYTDPPPSSVSARVTLDGTVTAEIENGPTVTARINLSGVVSGDVEVAE